MSAIISCDECPGLRDRGQNLLPSRCLSPSCRLSLTDTLFILRDQDQADVLVSQPLAFISSSLPSAVDAFVGVFTRAVEEIGGNRNDSSITSLLLSLSDQMTYQTRWPIRLDDLLRHRWKTTRKKMNQESVGSDSGFSDQKILLLLMFNPLWDPVQGLGEGWEGGCSTEVL